MRKKRPFLDRVASRSKRPISVVGIGRCVTEIDTWRKRDFKVCLKLLDAKISRIIRPGQGPCLQPDRKQARTLDGSRLAATGRHHAQACWSCHYWIQRFGGGDRLLPREAQCW